MMEGLEQEILVILDLAGLGLTLWLGLHLMTHAWGWNQGQARLAGLTAWALGAVFALSLYDGASPVAGASATRSLARLALLPLPFLWLALTRQFGPGVLLARSRSWLLISALVTLLTLAGTLLLGPLRPEYLSWSWLFLPFYLATLLLSLGLAGLAASRGRAILGAVLEQRTMALMLVGALLLGLALTLQATDFVLRLEHPWLRGVAVGIGGELRIAARASLLVAALLLALATLVQARADGASHISQFSHSFLVTLIMTLFYLALGGIVVRIWSLPLALLGAFLMLALLTDWLDNATRARLERWLFRGPTGQLRGQLRRIADHLDPQGELPPALRPLLSRLARQLNSRQLGLALREPKDNSWRIRLALRPQWEGQRLDVRDPNTWEERALGGWNMPLRGSSGQTIGVIASEPTGPLSPLQVRALEDSTRDIASLLDRWQQMARERETLQKTLAAYETLDQEMERRFRRYAAPPSRGRDLRKAVRQALERFNDAGFLAGHTLTQLNVISENLSPGQKSGSGRARLLQQVLSDLVEQLRPMEGSPPSTPGAAWFPYLAIQLRYLEGKKEEEVLERLATTRRAMRRAIGQGVDQIARSLAELDAAIQPAPTSPTPTATPGRAAAWQSDSTPSGRPPAAAGRSNPIRGLTGRFRGRREQGARPEATPTGRGRFGRSSPATGGTAATGRVTGGAISGQQPALGSGAGLTRSSGTSPAVPSSGTAGGAALPSSGTAGTGDSRYPGTGATQPLGGGSPSLPATPAGFRSLKERFGEPPPPGPTGGSGGLPPTPGGRSPTRPTPTGSSFPPSGVRSSTGGPDASSPPRSFTRPAPKPSEKEAAAPPPDGPPPPDEAPSGLDWPEDF